MLLGNHLTNGVFYFSTLNVVHTLFSISWYVQEIWANAHEARDSISLISCACCFGVSPEILVKNHSLSVPRSLKSRKIHWKPLFYGFKVVQYGTPGKLVSSACYDKQSLCLPATVLTLGELIVVNSDFLRGYPYLMLSCQGNLLAQRHEICSQETRDSRLSW